MNVTYVILASLVVAAIGWAVVATLRSVALRYELSLLKKEKKQAEALAAETERNHTEEVEKLRNRNAEISQQLDRANEYLQRNAVEKASKSDI